MLKNYFKIAFRFMGRHKIHALINVLGLAIGLACFILIFLFVRDELSFDKFHSNGDRLYRIAGLYDQGGDKRNPSAQTTYLLKKWLDTSFPDIERVVRLGQGQGLIKYEDKTFQEDRLLFVDEGFFEMFSFPLIRGGAATVIDEPNSVVVTESTARKYFGDQDPIGKSIDLDGNVLVKITGVMADMPHNSHFQADLVFSMKTIEPYYPDWVLTNGTGTSHYTYVQLRPGVTPQNIEKQLADYMLSLDKDYAESRTLFLQPVPDIHLHSKLTAELGANGDITYVAVLSAVAIIILLMACFNYMNLAIARSANRAREVGIRKVAGAQRKQLMAQFLGEAILTSLFALLCALILAELGMPLLNQLSGKNLEINLVTNPALVAVLVLLAVLVGGLAGSYPAIVLSAFQAVSMLKGKIARVGHKSINLRKALLITQFIMSIVLLMSTLVIFDQLTFMRNKKLGINPEQVVVVPFQTGEIAKEFEQFRAQLLGHSDIIDVAATNNNLTGRISNWRGYRFPDKADKIYLPTAVVTPEFLSTLQAGMVAGRDFNREFPADVMHSYIINEAAAKLLGLETPVGATVTGDIFTGSTWSKKEATIIGVVKDFHLASLHTEIQPTVFSVYSEQTTPLQYMAVRVSAGNLPATMATVEKTWKTFAPQRPMQYSFMDEDIDGLYRAEERFMQIFIAFVTLAIAVTCLGLFGLSSYAAMQRTREIGIRKVLGASNSRLVAILSAEFLKLVAVSNLVAWPVAWYLMNEWLQDFAYRIEIVWWMFVLSGGLALVIALLTVSTQAIRAALANPVQTLRYE